MTLSLILMNTPPAKTTPLVSRQPHTHTFPAPHAETHSNPSFESTRLLATPYLASSLQERCTQTPHFSSPAPDRERPKSAGTSPKTAPNLTSTCRIQNTVRIKEILGPGLARIERLIDSAKGRLKTGSIRQNRGRVRTCRKFTHRGVITWRKQTPLQAHPASPKRPITCRKRTSARPHQVSRLRLITCRKQISTRHHPAPKLRLITLCDQTPPRHHPALRRRLMTWRQQTTPRLRLDTSNPASTLCRPVTHTAS
jgi:hypothetical protein